MWARAVVLGTMVALMLAGVASAAVVVLPDSRRYELVSPPAKNGVEVITQTNKVHVRPDGNAVTFSALGGFGPVDGSAFDFQYMSRRTGPPGNGWASHGINPLGRPVTFMHAERNAPTFVDAFTPDLSVGIYKTWRPLVDAPNVREVSNLYRITGLDGGLRTVQIMSDSVNPVPASWVAFLNGFFVRTIQPELVGASSDLRHVVFESVLSLTSDAPAYPADFCGFAGFGCPTHLYENHDGLVRLVGRIPDAGQTVCDDVAGPACVAAPTSTAGVSSSLRFYAERMVSEDGRRILFDVPGSGIFLREDGVRTEQIATSGQLWDASRDGSRAFFISDQPLVASDTDTTPDVYMYDRDATPGDRLTLVSASSITDGYAEAIIGASDDGEYLYFVCDGQLIPGEPEAPIMGLYVWHAGQLRFIGTLVGLGEAELNSPRTFWSIVSATRTSRVTPDGRHLLFMTQNDAGFRGRGGFTGYEHNGHRELYHYNADSGGLACASCHPRGRAATTDALIEIRENEATSQTTADSAQALTDDGRRVFFNTAEALVPQDVNGRPDPYEYDATSGRVHLLTSGVSTVPSYVLDASTNGDDVFIITRERLVGWDIDASYDLYDARVGGGFPEPPTPSPACTGDACLPAAATAPDAANPGSSANRGPGNVRARLKRHRRCGRRRVLRRIRGKRKCVKRRPHKRRSNR